MKIGRTKLQLNIFFEKTNNIKLDH